MSEEYIELVGVQSLMECLTKHRDANAGHAYIGKTITSAHMSYSVLFLFFGEHGIALQDEAMRCCERRYMTTDDDPASIIGGKLLKIEIADRGRIMEHDEEGNILSDDYHEVVFVKVETDKGFLTLCTHNEHNGYYGGFDLTITEIQQT